MQLAEYMMWKNQQCNTTNRYASIAAVFILVIQPLALIASMYLFGNSILSKSTLFISTLIAALIALGSCIFVLNRMSQQKRICTLPGKQGFLEWDLDALSGKNKVPMILAAIFGLYYWGSSGFLLTLRPLSQGIVYFLMFTLSFSFHLHLLILLIKSGNHSGAG